MLSALASSIFVVIIDRSRKVHERTSCAAPLCARAPCALLPASSACPRPPTLGLHVNLVKVSPQLTHVAAAPLAAVNAKHCVCIATCIVALSSCSSAQSATELHTVDISEDQDAVCCDTWIALAVALAA